MTRTLPLPTRTEAPHVTELDARLRLDTAVAALTQPTVEKLDRDDPRSDSRAAQLALADRRQAALDEEYEQRLVTKHADLLNRKHAAQARHVLAALIAHRLARIDRQLQQRTVRAEIPSLLDQVRDAVQSSSGGGGSGSVGPNRSPIGLGAAELLHAIARATAAPRGSYLPAWVQAWATTPDDVDAAADSAEQWIEQAQAILTPPKRWTHPGACPACGKTTAYVADESGQQVRRPALELNRADATARCLRCGASWKGEGQLRSLARVLEDESVT